MKADWKYVKLGEVCEIRRGLTYSKSDETSTSSKVVLRSNNVELETHQMNYEELKYIKEDFEIPIDKYIKDGELLMCMSNGSKVHLGKVALYKGETKYAFGGFMSAIQHKDSLIDKFFYYALTTPFFQEYIKALSDGANINNLKSRDILEYTIPLPSLSEQGEIVAYLDKEFALIDALREKATLQLQAAKDLFQSALKQLLTPKHGWEEKKINNLAKNLDSKRIPITSTKRVAGIYPYYGASGVVDYVNSYIFDEDLLLISEDGANLLMRTTPIAFSVSGKIWVNNHAHVFRFANKSTQKYVEYFFASKDISEYITGAAQPKLAQKLLNKIPIPLPTLSEQEEIVRTLDALSEKCRQLEENYRQTITLCNDLKQALLRQVFE